MATQTEKLNRICSERQVRAWPAKIRKIVFATVSRSEVVNSTRKAVYDLMRSRRAPRSDSAAFKAFVVSKEKI